MKKFILTITILLQFLCTSCKKESVEKLTLENPISLNDPVHNDLNDYIINNMRPTLESFESAMNDFTVLSTDSDSYGGLLTTLERNIIPKIAQLVKKLEDIKPKTEEVRKVHIIFVKATKDILSATEQMKKSLRSENPDLMEDANRKIEKANNDMEEYKLKLRELSRKHNTEHLLSAE